MSWDDEIIEQVWRRGVIVPENEPNNFRKDSCGAWIRRRMYGNRDSTTNFGWEIDHIDPNGGDVLSNLQPLHWKNNLDKSDGRASCNITANGTGNIERG